MRILHKVLRNCHMADIEEYDGKVLAKKLNQCIEKAYCKCNWQRILGPFLGTWKS